MSVDIKFVSLQFLLESERSDRRGKSGALVSQSSGVCDMLRILTDMLHRARDPISCIALAPLLGMTWFGSVGALASSAKRAWLKI